MAQQGITALSFGVGRTLPIIRQDELAECGLASLAMVAGYHGIRTDLRAMRRRFPITARGWTLRTLADNAGRLGFSTRALKCGLRNVGQLRLPAILHWDLNHFVVLKSVSRNRLVIHDPARGVVNMTFETFSDHFTGIALELIPTAELKPTDERSRLSFSSLWSQMTGLGGTLSQIVLFSLIMQVFVIASPQYLQIVVDTVLPALDVDLLLILAIGFALLLVMQLVASVLRDLVILHAGTTLAYQITANLFHRLIRLPLVYFESRHMGGIISRFESVDPIKDFLVQGLVKSVIDGLMAIITLGLLFIYSPMLALIVLGATLLYLELRLILLRRMRNLTEETILADAAEHSSFIETLRGILPIKAFADESNRQLRWQNLLAETFNSSIRLQRLNIGFDTGRNFIFEIERIIVVFLAARMVMQGNFTVGMIFAFTAYREQFSSSAASLVEVLIEFRMLRLHLDRIADIALTEPERSDGTILDLTGGGFKVEGVTFAYGDAAEPVLRDVSFQIAPGESVALVGPSGGGKTTLLKLLMGLMTPQSGTIIVDGVPLEQRDQSHFRRQVASVMQDDHLFSGSIAENITFFDVTPDFELLEACAKRAQIHDDIQKMPMGYETLVGDMGATLSGGQIQRLILARALYREPRILFVDEGTSNLDLETEKAVNAAIAELGITRIIVAHRKETIESAERVLVVQGESVAPAD